MGGRRRPRSARSPPKLRTTTPTAIVHTPKVRLFGRGDSLALTFGDVRRGYTLDLTHVPSSPPEIFIVFDVDQLLSFDERSTFTVETDGDGMRLDHFLADRAGWTSRSKIAGAVRDGRVTVNGVVEIRPSHRLSGGDSVTAWIEKTPRDLSATLDDVLPLMIVREAPDWIVVEKPAGLAAHPVGGTIKRTLLVAAALEFTGRFEKGGPFIPHRLDRETSGLSVVAWTKAAATRFSDGFADRSIRRFYRALTASGAPAALERFADPQTIDFALTSDVTRDARVKVDPAGTPCKTRVQCIERTSRYAQWHIEPITGRAHQIRVHLASIGFPILGDPVYGDPRAASRMMLHAERLLVPARIAGLSADVDILSGTSLDPAALLF